MRFSVVMRVRFSSDGRFLAIGHCDGTVYIYGINEGAKIWFVNPLKDFIHSFIAMLCSEFSADELGQGSTSDVCFNPDGTCLAIAREDKRIMVSY